MGEKNCLIISYLYSQENVIPNNDKDMLPVFIKDMSNVVKMELNGENIISVIHEDNYNVLTAKQNIGINTLKIKLKNKEYSIGLKEHQDSDISFNSCVLNINKFKNVIINVASLNITEVKKHAFFNLKNVISIKLPNTLKYIGDNAFVGCPNLSSLILKCSDAPTLGISVFGDFDCNCTGRNTYSLGMNKLYLQTNSKGYDQNDWSNILLNESKCGFKIDTHWSFNNL